MAALVVLLTSKWRRRALDVAVNQRRTSSAKRMPELENNLMNFVLPISLANLTQDRKTRSRDEIRNKKWWEDGPQNWSEPQFKKRLRFNRDTFHFILEETDLITKETTRFKKPTSTEQQLALPHCKKNPQRFRLDIRRFIRLLARLEDVLTDESASDEFYSIIGLRTVFMYIDKLSV